MLGVRLNVMPKTSSRSRPFSFCIRSVALASITCLLPATGCEKTPPVVTYTIPLEAPPEFQSEQARMLAAMVPLTDQVWFFKVTGPESAVELIHDQLRQFVETVSFDGGQPKLEDLPDGWRKSGQQTQFRFASINVDTPEKQLDISVSKLGRQPDWDAMVAMNVNRWRGQLGLAKSDAKWADAESIDVAAADDKAVWLDIVGDQSSAGAPMMSGPAMPRNSMGGPAPVNRTPPRSNLPPMPPPVASAQASSQADIPPMEPDPRLKFDRPDGWRDGEMRVMRMAAFRVGPEDRVAVLTVIPAGGDLRGNVARWLGQARGNVAPKDVVDAAMEAVRDVGVDGREGKRFFLTDDAV